jgi:hypothetical protein
LLKLLRQTRRWPISQRACDEGTATGVSAAADAPERLPVEVQRELRPGESVRWIGRPRRIFLDLAVVLAFGVVLLILAALLFIGVELSFRVGGGRYWRRRTRRTVYAVTDWRAMIVVAPGHVVSFLPSQLTAMKTATEPGGPSAVYFHPPVVKGDERKYWSGFEALADPGEALGAIDLLRRSPVGDCDISHNQ